MAMLEAHLIVATVLRRYRVDLVPGYEEEPECILDMRPRHEVRVTLHARKGAG